MGSISYVDSRCRNEVKARRESRDPRHREKVVNIRESNFISIPADGL